MFDEQPDGHLYQQWAIYAATPCRVYLDHKDTISNTMQMKVSVKV